MADTPTRNPARSADRPDALHPELRAAADPASVSLPAAATQGDSAQPIPLLEEVDESEEYAPAIDDNGFDPSEFEWRPVPRRPRSDGWTPEVQRKFIQALADTGVVSAACREVDMSVASAYRLRNAPGSESLRRAWDAAIAAAADQLVDVAFSRALEGVDDPVFDRDGVRIGARRRYNDRLLMFLLRAYHPDRFRYAHHDARVATEAPPPPDVPFAVAMDALGPVLPPDPHKSLPRDRFEGLAHVARVIGDLDEMSPPDTRERYDDPPVEDTHPAAHERARIRRQRETETEERRRERYGERSAFDHPVPEPYGLRNLKRPGEE